MPVAKFNKFGLGGGRNGPGSPVGGLTLNQGGAAAYASRPAPAGYRWDFVTQNNARVTQNGAPVVALVGA